MHLVHAQTTASPDAKLTQFTRALDALCREVEAEAGESDLVHLERMRTLSRRLGLLGHGLLHFSVEPVAFSAGVLALWVHKCLEQMEIGHAALAGAPAPTVQAEEHETATSPWETTAKALDWLALTNSLELHMEDAVALFTRHVQSQVSAAQHAEPARLGLHHQLHLRALGYLAKTVATLPLLAKPFFWKVALGNVVSEAARDLFASAMTQGGRVRTSTLRAPTTQEQRCLAQIASARDIEVPRVVSILCGALDKRIEHRLFPHLPPQRLRKLAPGVRALCMQHGIAHPSASLLDTLRLLVDELRDRR
jgi:linoleoyl-CoA desaturase